MRSNDTPVRSIVDTKVPRGQEAAAVDRSITDEQSAGGLALQHVYSRLSRSSSSSSSDSGLNVTAGVDSASVSCRNATPPVDSDDANK